MRRTSHVPIVMLTARADTSDVVAGLELGADDYVTKPFEPAVLAARIRSVLRRADEDYSGAPNGSQDVLVGRDLRIDLPAQRAFRGDQELLLTPTEFRLLVELIANRARVLSREALLERVYGKPDAKESDIDAVVRAMEETGARARVEVRVRELCDEARHALDAISPTMSAVGRSWLAGAVTALGDRAS